jgi:hypothetical protein
MFLMYKSTHDLVEVLDLREMYDPCMETTKGRYHAGEELQDPETFKKSELAFPSGEELPACWLDPDYRSHLEEKQHMAMT